MMTKFPVSDRIGDMDYEQEERTGHPMGDVCLLH